MNHPLALVSMTMLLVSGPGCTGCSDTAETDAAAPSTAATIASEQEVPEEDTLTALADSECAIAPIARPYGDLETPRYDGEKYIYVLRVSTGKLNLKIPYNQQRLPRMVLADLGNYDHAVIAELIHRGQPLVFECFLDEAPEPSLSFSVTPAQLQKALGP